MLARKSLAWIVGCLAVFALSAAAAAETHWNLQAVDGSGVGTWSGSYPLTLTGLILNDPEEVLDPSAGFVAYDSNNVFPIRMGGQWQVFVQPIDANDHAGTALWMGQNYGNLPYKHDSSLSYTDAEWTAEMARVNYDANSGHQFRKGDLVMVTANITGFYGGKTNVNEAHFKTLAYDFTLSLLEANYGLPAPEVISIADVMRVDDGNADTHEDIFDANRLTGGEYYQGRYVRINGVTLTDANGWGLEDWDDRLCTITDGNSRYFTLRMPRGSVVDLGAAPTREFDAIGILNQESGSSSDGTFAYELFVTEVIPEPLTVSAVSAGAVALLWRRKRRGTWRKS
ncbi:MAG TPA: PEP-CTERM sorting domain-containing protein [Phycisphaerae bacterium]|nr:PEP-CTERM sorting domain-containing protein [Phycisphaerae bacterium]